MVHVNHICTLLSRLPRGWSLFRAVERYLFASVHYGRDWFSRISLSNPSNMSIEIPPIESVASESPSPYISHSQSLPFLNSPACGSRVHLNWLPISKDHLLTARDINRSSFTLHLIVC